MDKTLKTLKDFEERQYMKSTRGKTECEMVCEDLRKEAIKWAKAYKMNIEEDYPFMRFHNLTEGDIK